VKLCLPLNATIIKYRILLLFYNQRVTSSQQMVSVLLRRAARLRIRNLLMDSRVSTASSPLERLISDAVLDAAYACVCRARCDWSPCADIWNFWHGWTDEKRRLKAELASGQFRFGLLERIWNSDGSEIELWAARDALVL
jgi:hypothetical protein